MTQKHPHIIQEFCFDIQSNTIDNHLDWQQQLTDFCKEKVPAYIESLLDKNSSHEFYTSIPSLEVDLGILSFSNWEQSFLQQLQIQLSKKLTEFNNIKNTTTTTKNQSERQTACFIYFIEHGTLPWWAKSEDIATYFNRSIDDVKPLQVLLKKRPLLIERVVYQCPNTYLKIIRESIVSSNTDQLLNELEVFFISLQQKEWKAKSQFTLQQWYWQEVLKEILIKGHTTNEQIKNFVYQILSQLISVNTTKISSVLKKQYDYNKLLINNSKKQSDVNNLKYEQLVNLVFFENLDSELKTFFPTINQIILNKKLFEEKSSLIKKHSLEDIFQSVTSLPKLEIEKPNIDLTENDFLPDKVSNLDSSKSKNEDENELESFNVKKEKLDKTTITNSNGVLEAKTTKLDDFPIRTHSNEVKEINRVHNASIIGLKEPNNFYYVSYAGIILIHPFIQRFFQNLKLVKGNNFVSKEAKIKAIHVLAYLSSGDENRAEFNLLLPKLLCDFPLNASLPKNLLLTQFEKQQAIDLLNAVIGHWTALKNSSIAALREGFFERMGKLEKQENQWMLNIESKTIDILIQKLPWQVNLIKLPWMDFILKTNLN